MVGCVVLGVGVIEVALAVEVGEKPSTPQLPCVPYAVHDGTRPQPRKVVSGGGFFVTRSTRMVRRERFTGRLRLC